MSDWIATTVSRLPGMTDLGEVYEEAGRRHAQGDLAFVADLGIALAERYGGSVAPLRRATDLFEHLLRLLTLTPGREHVEQAVRLVSATASGERDVARFAASLLADCQDWRDLAPFLAAGGSLGGAAEELGFCLVHELVLRGLRAADAPELRSWTAPRPHPLAWLPLELSPVEGTPPLPAYSQYVVSFEMPYGALDDAEALRAGAAPLPRVTDTTVASFGEAATAAVANWVEGSNGRTQAGVYELAEPIEAGSLPGFLKSLDLVCLRGTGADELPAVVGCGPADAWGELFAAASHGGAYNGRMYGAYGRLTAWRSLGALSGAPAAAVFCDAERAARGRDWYSFRAPTPWFVRAAWRIGLVAVAPGRRRLAVMTASDTD